MDGTGRERSSSLLRVGRVVVTMLALGGLLFVVHPRRIGSVMIAAEPTAIAIAGLAYSALILLRVERWLRIATWQGASLTYRSALRTYALGMLVGAVTPGRVGQHIKAVALVKGGLSWPRALAATVVDQLTDLVIMMCLLPVALAHFGRNWFSTGKLAATGLAVVVGVAVLAVWRPRRLTERVCQARAEIVALGAPKLTIVILLSLAAQLCYFASLYSIGRSVSLGVSFTTLTLAMVASTLIEAVPMTVAGLGTREVSVYALLRPFGADLSRILSLTLMVRVLHIVVGGIAWFVGEDVKGAEIATASDRPQQADENPAPLGAG